MLNNVGAGLNNTEKAALTSDINKTLEQQNLQKIDNTKALGDEVVKKLNEVSESNRISLQKDIASAVLRQSQTAFEQNRIQVTNRAISASEIMRNELGKDLSKIDASKRSQILSRLPENPPVLPGKTPALLPKDREDLIIALVTHTITPNQATEIIQRLHTQDALRKGEPVGLTQFLSQNQDSRQGLPISEITVNKLKDAIHKLNVEFDNDQFSKGFLASFKSFIATESDFFKFSLRVLLDPAQSMVKNFSIQTRDSTAMGMQSALVIPISG